MPAPIQKDLTMAGSVILHGEGTTMMAASVRITVKRK